MSQLNSTFRTLPRRLLRLARDPVRRALRPFRRPLNRVRRYLPRRVDALLARVAGSTPPRRRRTVTPPPAELVERTNAARPSAGVGGTRLYIGPANFAGQAHLWARSAEKNLAGVSVVNMAVEKSFRYPADYTVPEAVYLNAGDWQRAQFEYVRRGFTHILIEAQRPLFGALYRSNPVTEARILSGYGLKVATIAHGRDIRLPSRHRETYPWSPYIPEEWPEVEILERQVRRNLAGLAALDLPAFVSTPDLLDDLPAATWCPVVIDPDTWAHETPPMTPRVPVVVHAPTSAKFKGSDRADPIMQALHDEGVIEYRRIIEVPWEEMRQIIQSADIVLEQFRLGVYGVTACEAMAAGRVVLGHVTEHNRQRVREAAGTDLPIVETTVDTLREVILGLVDDRDRARSIAARGPGFTQALHDGVYSARVLSSFLG